MKRKVLVLAVGAALAPLANAQVVEERREVRAQQSAQIISKAGSEWEFYGKLYPELAQISGTGATSTPSSVSSFNPAPPATSVSGLNSNHRSEMLVSNSHIGFRGSKDIGSGTKAIWQIEQTVPLDEGGDAAGAGTLATRDTFMGAAGEFGTFRVGFMDTPFKRYGDVLGFLGVSSGNFVQTNPVLRQVGFGQGANGPNRASRFHERRGNALDFVSPTYFGGAELAVQYSTGNPSETSHTATPTPRDPRFISMAVKYERGPMYFALMHETHYDMFGGSTNSIAAAQSNVNDAGVHSTDRANQATVMYRAGSHTIEADYILKSYNENPSGSVAANPTGRFQSYSNKAWMVAWEGRWSSTWRTAATYVSADAGNCSLFNVNTCTTAGLEGTQISLGGSYYIDRNFYLFLIGSKITNGKSARYDNVSNGSPAAGEDVTQYALGMAYTF